MYTHTRALFICTHAHARAHTHTSLVPLDNQSNIAAIVGGIVGGLVALGITVSVSLFFDIAAAVNVTKRGSKCYRCILTLIRTVFVLI